MADVHTPEDQGFYEDEGITCPRCMGNRTVDCHCGGDLCVCENYGERDCPTCDLNCLDGLRSPGIRRRPARTCTQSKPF